MLMFNLHLLRTDFKAGSCVKSTACKPDRHGVVLGSSLFPDLPQPVFGVWAFATKRGAPVFSTARACRRRKRAKESKTAGLTLGNGHCLHLLSSSSSTCLSLPSSSRHLQTMVTVAALPVAQAPLVDGTKTFPGETLPAHLPTTNGVKINGTHTASKAQVNGLAKPENFVNGYHTDIPTPAQRVQEPPNSCDTTFGPRDKEGSYKMLNQPLGQKRPLKVIYLGGGASGEHFSRLLRSARASADRTFRHPRHQLCIPCKISPARH